jgi:DNA invertase Pin-like site-specific DNA recombinase
LISLGIQFISYQENIDTTSPLGQALFTIVSAVAQLERDLIRERVRAGLRNARAKGKKFGRPRVEIDAVRVAELRRDGLSWSQVCRTLNVSKGSAQRSVATIA